MGSSKKGNSFWTVLYRESGRESIKLSSNGRNAKAGTNKKKKTKKSRFVNLYSGRFRKQEKKIR